jgi:hypothetical protein
MQITVNKTNAGYRGKTVDQVVEEYVSQGWRVVGYFNDHNMDKAASLVKPESHRDYLLRNRHR